ncbi:MAG: hypothetical protein Q9169_002013 [Polycauliona sp. 2 TL-2023]
MSPISYGTNGHQPSSSKTNPMPSTLPPLSFDVDSLAMDETKTVREIDPTDSSRFLFGSARRGSSDYSDYKSYSVADLPSLPNRPGPLFLYIPESETKPNKSDVFISDARSNKKFVCEVDGNCLDCAIPDILLLVTSIGSPCFLPLKYTLLSKAMPNTRRSSFANQGQTSVPLGLNYRDLAASASDYDKIQPDTGERSTSFSGLNGGNHALWSRQRQLKRYQDCSAGLDMTAAQSHSGVSNDIGIQHTTNNHPNEDPKSPHGPFCNDVISTGSRLLPKEAKRLLLDSGDYAHHRALLTQAQSRKVTAADEQALDDYHRYPGDLSEEILKIRAWHDDLSSRVAEAMHQYQIYRRRGFTEMDGGGDMLGARVHRARSQQATHRDEEPSSTPRAQYEMAIFGDDIEKGRRFDVERSGRDEGYYHCGRCSHLTGNRQLGKKVRSMIFWIVVAVLLLGTWLDKMHGSHHIVGGRATNESVGGLRGQDDGERVFPQLDPGAPDVVE